MEELVAELGSAFLCADLDLTPEIREDHAAYIASWLEVLKNDKRAIFSAAAHAQRAADFLGRIAGEGGRTGCGLTSWAACPVAAMPQRDAAAKGRSALISEEKFGAPGR